MRRIVCGVLVLICTVSSFSVQTFALKAGVNFSRLMRHGHVIQSGAVFGIRQESVKKNTGWMLEMLFTTQRAVIRDKAVGYYDWNEEIGYYDLVYRRTTLDLPVLVKRQIHLTQKIHVDILLEVRLSIQLSDDSKRLLLRKEPLPNPSKREFDRAYFDFKVCRECGGYFDLGNPVSVITGLEIFWGNKSFEIRIPLPDHPVSTIRNVIVDENQRCFYLLFGIHF